MLILYFNLDLNYNSCDAKIIVQLTHVTHVTHILSQRSTQQLIRKTFRLFSVFLYVFTSEIFFKNNCFGYMFVLVAQNKSFPTLYEVYLKFQTCFIWWIKLFLYTCSKWIFITTAVWLNKLFVRFKWHIFIWIAV